jgi:hypothetical protein
MPRHARSSPIPTMSSVALSSDSEEFSDNDTMPEKPRPAKRLKQAIFLRSVKNVCLLCP